MPFLAIILGYLFGSIPFAYLAGRLVKGIDIRTVGTKNMGAHNVMLEVGRLVGIAVLLLDIGKGALSVLMARWMDLPDWAALLAGVAAVLGHNFPVFLGFSGGRGLAASIGAILVLLPKEAMVALPILGVLYILITHSPSFSAIISFIILSLLAWLWTHQPLVLTLSPRALGAAMGTKQLPEAIRLWMSAEDKGDLILNRFILNREGRI